jgi:hypothetical protein
MAILLYCIAKADAPATTLLTGVAGDPVVGIEVGNLAAFTSRNLDSSIWMRPRLQASALEFHDVVSEVFKSAAIIPFRFPTIFENEEQLIERLKERSSEYCGLLEKFRDLVQMEIRLTNPALKTPPESGTQYLKSRQTATRKIEKFTSQLRATLSPLSQEWRQRPSKDGLRAFALVERGRVEEFGRIMINISVPSGLSVRVSGPWPVSEFIEQS